MRERLEQAMSVYGTNVTLKSLKHVKLIGVGAFGSVRLVEHKLTAVRYALKRIRKQNGAPPPEALRECSLLAENAHPFLLQFVDKFVGDTSIYILTELVTGGQLYRQVLEKMGVLSRKHAQFYVGSLVLTLEALHERSIVYRDLKPENVMLDHQGYVKLVDFGLAKRLEDSPHTYTCSGTPHYMAPEVIAGHGYGTECDIWSLGVIFFELVCGRLPFGAEAEDVPSILGAVMEAPLEVPSRYNDVAGKKLIAGLLCRSVEQRLGAGQRGWDDVKAHKFFRSGVSGDLFGKIAGRELSAPLLPEGEEYGDEGGLYEQTTLSDAEELGVDEPVDMGCRLMATFRRFDVKGDGRVDRCELGEVLRTLDAETFTDEVVDSLMEMLDRSGSGAVTYEEFVAWMLGSDAEDALKKALRGAVKLDVHC